MYYICISLYLQSLCMYTQIYRCVCVYISIYMCTYVGCVLFKESRLYLLLCVPCIKSLYICMLYFIGDSSSIYTLPVCLQNDCVRETLCVCVYNEQVYTGISYLLITLCVCVCIHMFFDINPQYTDNNKDISEF